MVIRGCFPSACSPWPDWRSSRPTSQSGWAQPLPLQVNSAQPQIGKGNIGDCCTWHHWWLISADPALSSVAAFGYSPPNHCPIEPPHCLWENLSLSSSAAYTVVSYSSLSRGGTLDHGATGSNSSSPIPPRQVAELGDEVVHQRLGAPVGQIPQGVEKVQQFPVAVHRLITAT